MIEDENYLHPLTWDNVDMIQYDGVWLTGGHAQGMKPYLESSTLQGQLRRYFPLTQG